MGSWSFFFFSIAARHRPFRIFCKKFVWTGDILSVLLDAGLSGSGLPKSIPAVLLTLPVIEAIALFNGERIVMALTPVQGGMRC